MRDFKEMLCSKIVVKVGTVFVMDSTVSMTHEIPHYK